MKHLELSLHERLWKLFEQYPAPGAVMRHIANGERRGPKTARQLKRMGVVSGTPDFVCHSREHPFFYVELKAPGETFSKDQKKFRASVAEFGIDVLLFDDIIIAASVLQRRGILKDSVRFVSVHATGEFEARDREQMKCS